MRAARRLVGESAVGGSAVRRIHGRLPAATAGHPADQPTADQPTTGLVRLGVPAVLCRDMSDWKRASAIEYLFVLLGAVAMACGAAACRGPQSGTPAVAVTADTWASVDGRPITRDE